MGEILSFSHWWDTTRKIKMKSMFLIMFVSYLSWHTSACLGVEGQIQHETYQKFSLWWIGTWLTDHGLPRSSEKKTKPQIWHWTSCSQALPEVSSSWWVFPTLAAVSYFWKCWCSSREGKKHVFLLLKREAHKSCSWSFLTEPWPDMNGMLVRVKRQVAL